MSCTTLYCCGLLSVVLDLNSWKANVVDKFVTDKAIDALKNDGGRCSDDPTLTESDYWHEFIILIVFSRLLCLHKLFKKVSKHIGIKSPGV